MRNIPIKIAVLVLVLAALAYFLKKRKAKHTTLDVGVDEAGGIVSPGTHYDPILGNIHPYNPNIPMHTPIVAQNHWENPIY